MPSAKTPVLHVSSVAIIGAGPSGLAAAKYLLAEEVFDRVDVYEQRSSVGGVWDYKPSNKTPPEFDVPQTDPSVDLNKHSAADNYLSPVYDLLETNIPHGLMGFSDLDWPLDAQLFPRHQTVTEYIEKYARDIKHLIKFSTKVTRVKQTIPHHATSGWTLSAQTEGGLSLSREYDAVVAASGHFNVPHVPPMRGLKAWHARYPDSVSHSMFYKTPERYRDKKVLLIGNGASGLDIASQIVTTCRWPLLHSTRSESLFLSQPAPSKAELDDVDEFLDDGSRSVRFVNGHVESDIECVLFCTGYLYSFPFLQLDPPLIHDGTRAQNVYQHLFYTPNPTLAMPVLQQRIIPFPMAEVQAAVFARVWSGRLQLPARAEMEVWEAETHRNTGGGRKFHLLKFPEDANYINAMHDFALSADDGRTRGKKPPHWGEKEYWMRERFPLMKKAYHELGQDRHKIHTVEELGFDYEQWKRDKEAEDHGLV